MAFPIIPRRRSGTAGNPTTLELGELAVNTATGKLYLGADGGVTELAVPVAAGTTVTEYTGDGTTTTFTFSGYNGTADGGYLVSVGGIDQPPSKYSISSTAGGTITFVEAPIDGELISIRAIVAGSGGGDGNATQIQGRDVASTAPTAGQVLAWNATASQWQPTSLNGSVTFNTAGTHQWAVPAWVRWVYVDATAGDGSDATATNGADGAIGQNAYFDGTSIINATTGENGADGTATQGAQGKSISIAAISATYNGGAGGTAIPGYGGGGSGGGGGSFFTEEGSFIGQGLPAPGAAGNGIAAGQGGGAPPDFASGGAGGTGGGGGTAGENGALYTGTTPAGGTGANLGGDGGSGGITTFGYPTGGGGGGGGNSSGGGGGGGGNVSSFSGTSVASAGLPGKGGTADLTNATGGTGDTFAGAVDFTTVAGTTIDIVISEGEGTASITITW